MNEKKKRVYISGGITNVPEYMCNFEMAEESGVLISVFTTKEIKDISVPQYIVTEDTEGENP